jgi:hypothetical protein
MRIVKDPGCCQPLDPWRSGLGKYRPLDLDQKEALESNVQSRS